MSGKSGDCNVPPLSPDSRVTSSARVSVVVPTRHRPRLLARCLAALLSQDFDAREFEIIVVDDGNNESTRRLVESLSASAPISGPELRYLPVTSRHGPAASRNVGWRAARGEIIAFTDDDCIPNPGWVRAGARAMTRGVTGAAGKIVVAHPATPTDYERDAAQLEGAEFTTANCFYRREDFAEIDGFDERFTSAWREDADVYLTFRERRKRLVHVPEAIVEHPVRAANWGVSLGQQRKSVFNALLYKKHRRLYRTCIQSTPPYNYYRTVAAILGMAVGIVFRKRSLAIRSLGWWLWLTGTFCLRRLRGTSHGPSHAAEMIVTSILIPPLALYWRLRGALRFKVWFL